MKLGYLPYSLDCSAPGDRRRFFWFIKEVNLKFEIADLKKKYDIIFVTYGSNLSTLLEYKKKYPKTKIIFEFIDAYLEDKNVFRIYLRGIVRFILGKEKTLYLNYNNLLKKFIKQSNVVICSTDQQRETLLKLNNNVRISLDYFEDDFRRRKKKYISKKNLDLFWEGKIYTMKDLKILNKLSNNLKNRIHVHILTDLEIEIIPNLYRLKAKNISKLFKFNHTIHQWSKKNVDEISNYCNLGIIPIITTNKIALNKPENKLVLMWNLGLPVITSHTPAYFKAMKNLTYRRICKDIKDWEMQLEEFLFLNEVDIKKDLNEIEKKLSEDYSKEKYKNDWFSIFQSININKLLLN